ncbi:DUF2313 domain-containing protein [bacterium D16-54]|nr:DUF2313 domain-containing protein [bacterium D16-54]RKJ11720.1 DUF2313 domain-containing protein [bacterium D16-56]
MLQDNITPLFAKTEQIRELFLVEQPEIDAMEQAVAGWIRELHIMTALNTIELWENDYHLDHNTELTIEQRRVRVFAKKMQRKIPKRESIEDAIRSMLGASQVSIVEGNCTFTVFVESMTLIDNLTIAEEYFRKVRVAHFGFLFINQIPRSYHMKKYFTPALVEHKKIKMEVNR